MCSAGHRLKFSYYNKMGFISLAQLVTPQTACHTAQVALLCQHPPANRAHLPCWTESLAELNRPALSPAAQHTAQLCPCHVQPLNQMPASFYLGVCKYLLGWEPVPVQIPYKVSSLRLIKRKQECLLQWILRVFTSLNRAFYEAFPYTTPQWCTAISQLSFISNHAILHYEANNNQAIACIA